MSPGETLGRSLCPVRCPVPHPREVSVGPCSQSPAPLCLTGSSCLCGPRWRLFPAPVGFLSLRTKDRMIDIPMRRRLFAEGPCSDSPATAARRLNQRDGAGHALGRNCVVGPSDESPELFADQQPVVLLAPELAPAARAVPSGAQSGASVAGPHRQPRCRSARPAGEPCASEPGFIFTARDDRHIRIQHEREARLDSASARDRADSRHVLPATRGTRVVGTGQVWASPRMGGRPLPRDRAMELREAASIPRSPITP